MFVFTLSTYLDMTQTITPKLQVVGAGPSASVAEVKCLFPLEWRPSVSIRNGLVIMLDFAYKQHREDLPFH